MQTERGQCRSSLWKGAVQSLPGSPAQAEAVLEINGLPISLLNTTGVCMGSWAGPALWETAVDNIGDALKLCLIWRVFLV